MGQARDEAGNIWETDAQGNAIRLIQPAQPAQQGRVFRDPGAQAEVQQGNADARNANVDANVNAATANAQISQAQAQAEQIRLENERLRNELASGGVSADRRSEVQDRISRLNQLSGQINRVQELFAQGPGATSGVWSVADYLPSDANARFDTAGAALSQQGLAAFRVPGTGTVSDRDAAMFDRANLPTASTRDAAIDEQLRGLRARVEEEYQTLGLPVPDWRGAPGPSAMDQTNFVTPAANMQASGGTGRTSTPIPPEMQQEYQAFVLGNAGTMTPEAYVRFRQGLDQKYGFESGDYTQEAERLIDGVRNGGTLNLTIPPVEQPMTGSQAIDDMVAGGGIGSGMAGFANTMSVGGVDGLAGDQYGAMRDANPGSMLTGEILGTLAPTTALGSLGRMITRRAAPSLLGGGTMASVGRGVATDAAYSGAYGANTGQNPLETAVEGGVGSLLGQTGGRLLGAGLRGVATSAPVQAMTSRGIPLTAGQTIGGMADRVEQRAMSLPVIGDMLRNRRIEGIEGFNQAAFNEAGAPIGFSPTAIGGEGLDQMGQAVSNAYRQATNGVTVPLDQQFGSELANVVQGASSLPQDGRQRLGEVLNARVQPLADAGQMTGETYQQARRGLSSARNSPPQQFAGFEDFYRDAVTGAQGVLDNQMMRGGGQNVVDGLTAANSANRNFRTIEDAANRNLGGSNTDMPQVFLPSQLQRAGLRTQQNFPGPRPFADLADNAQQVLPQTIPNSGTADRGMQAGLMALGGAGLGGAAGYAAGGDGQSAAGGAALPASLFAMMALASTKQGQRALTSALTKRNPTVRAFGEQLRRRSGLFGSAAIPLALQSEY